MDLRNCENIRDNLSLYIDNLLSPSETLAIENHIENCKECRDEYTELLSLVNMLNDLEELELPDNFHNEFMEKLEEEIANSDKDHLVFSFSKPRKINFDKIYKFSKYAQVAAVSMVLVGFVSSYLSLHSFNSSDLLNLANDYLEPATVSLDVAEAIPETENFENALAVTADLEISADLGVSADHRVPAELGRNINETENFENALAVTADLGVSADLGVPADHRVPAELGRNIGRAIMPTNAVEIPEDLTSHSMYFTLNTNDIEAAVEVCENLGYLNSSKIVANTTEGNSIDFILYELAVDRTISYNDLELVLLNLGNVTSKSNHMVEHTNDYVFYASKVNVYTEELARLTELLTSSDDLQSLIYIENRISDLSNEIDTYKGILNNIDKDIAYSKVYIELNSSLDTSFKSPVNFSYKLKNAVISSATNTFKFLENSVVFFISNILPIGLITLVFSFAIPVFLKKLRKRRNVNNE